MKKDNIRDYATDAFRLYASLGMPSKDTLENKIRKLAMQEQKKNDVKTKGISKPTEYAIINAQRAVDEFESTLLDILAVENTLKIIAGRSNAMEIIKAIEIVYFTEPNKPIKKGDIQDRVYRAVFNIPASERSIYRNLSLARNIFAEERGLRNSKVGSSRFKLCDIMIS